MESVVREVKQAQAVLSRTDIENTSFTIIASAGDKGRGRAESVVINDRLVLIQSQSHPTIFKPPLPCRLLFSFAERSGGLVQYNKDKL